MRTLTIDAQGLAFTAKIFSLLILAASVYSIWIPAQTYVLERRAAQSNNPTTEAPQNTSTTNGEQPSLLGGIPFEDDDNGAEASLLEFIPAKGRFISVDLVRKQIFLYESGDFVQSVPVVRTPDPESFAAVPQGFYAVESHNDAEVSSLSLLRLPYHVGFGDRFSFHGEPTAPDGSVLTDEEKVSGCVELSREDAKYVYNFALVGTPISVRGAPAPAEYTSNARLVVATKKKPATSALAYGLIDLTTGQEYAVKNNGERYPIASVTKLITAAVASDSIGHGTDVRAPNGQYYTLGDLFYPLLLRSDNGVAQALAAHGGTAAFITDMNTWVKSIGMSATSFADSSGLSPKNLSTIHDLSLLARYLFADKRYILDISREETMTITSAKGVKWTMKNQNKVARDPYFQGGKLGYTDEARQTALSVFTVPLAGEPHAVAVVILGSYDWKQDTRTLLRWLIENAETEDTLSEE